MSGRFSLSYGCFIAIALCFCSTAGQVVCDSNQASFLGCDQQISDVILAEVTSRGGNNISFLADTNLTDATEAEFYYDIVADVFCRETNALVADCFVSPLILCPALAVHADTEARLLASTLADNLDDVTNLTTACAFLRTTRCSLKRLRFDACFSRIRARGNVPSNATSMDTSVFCINSDAVADTTCILEMHDECPAAVLDNNDIVPWVTGNMLNDHWSSFQSGAAFCSCERYQTCNDDVLADVTQAITDNAENSKAEQGLAVSKLICSDLGQQANLECATTLASDQCRAIDDVDSGTYQNAVTRNSIWKTLGGHCDVIQSNFDNNWVCVRGNLSSVDACVNNVNSHGLTCLEYRALYDCIAAALGGKCGQEASNLNYVNAAFDMYVALRAREGIQFCHSAPVQSCPNNNTAFLACASSLSAQISSTVQADGKDAATVLRTPDGNWEYYFQTLGAVFCSSSLEDDARCFVNELDQCPSLALDQSLTAVLPALGAVSVRDQIRNTTGCEYLSAEHCAMKRVRFDRCFSNIRGNIIQGESSAPSSVPISKFCGTSFNDADAISNTSCILETYQACPTEVLADNEQLVPLLTQTQIKVDRWVRFQDGNQLCTCYRGDVEFERIRSALAISAKLNPITDADSTFEHIYSLAKVLCGETVQDNLRHASYATISECSQVLGPVNSEAVKTIANYQSASDMCTVINAGFNGQWKDCVKVHLKDPFNFCLHRIGVNNLDDEQCKGQREMYDCCKEALSGRCGMEHGDHTFINATYDMMRIYYKKNMRVCEDIKTSSTSILRHNWAFLFFVALLVVL